MDADYHCIYPWGIPVPQSRFTGQAMIGCTWEIGQNLLTVLMGVGVSLTPIITAYVAVLTKRTNHELNPNQGGSMKDTVNRTESTVAAMAQAQGIEHITGPIPVVSDEGKKE